MAAALLDEGAGDIDSNSFHERVEAKAIEIGFTATRDYVSGSLRTLTEHQDEAFNFYYPDTLNLLRLAGAELVPFSPLHDHVLPEKIAGIYLNNQNRWGYLSP